MTGERRKKLQAIGLVAVMMLSAVALGFAGAAAAYNPDPDPTDPDIVADSANQNEESIHTVTVDIGTASSYENLETITIDYGDGTNQVDLSQLDATEDQADYELYVNGDGNPSSAFDSVNVGVDDSTDTITLSGIESDNQVNLGDNDVITLEIGLDSQPVNPELDSIGVDVDIETSGADYGTESGTLTFDDGDIELGNLDYNRLDLALDDAENDDTVTVTADDIDLPDLEDRDVTIDNDGLTLQGEDGDEEVVLSGSDQLEQALEIGASEGVEVSNLVFDGSSEDVEAIVVTSDDANSFNVSENEFDDFEDTDQQVIDLSGDFGDDGLIADNVFEGGNEVAQVIAVEDDGERLTIDGNEFDTAALDGDELIDVVEAGDELTITANTFSGTDNIDQAVDVADGGLDGLFVGDNVFENFGSGDETALLVTNVGEDATVYNTTFDEDTDVGELIQVDDADDGLEVLANVLEEGGDFDGTAGIHVNDIAGSVDVSENVFEDTGTDAISIESDGETITAHNNSIAFGGTDTGIIISDADVDSEITVSADGAEIGDDSSATGVDISDGANAQSYDVEGLTFDDVDVGILVDDVGAGATVTIDDINVTDAATTGIHINEGSDDLRNLNIDNVEIDGLGTTGIDIAAMEAGEDLSFTNLEVDGGESGTAIEFNEDLGEIDLQELHFEDVDNGVVVNEEATGGVSIADFNVTGVYGSQAILLDNAEIRGATISDGEINALDEGDANGIEVTSFDSASDVDIDGVEIDGGDNDGYGILLEADFTDAIVTNVNVEDVGGDAGLEVADAISNLLIEDSTFVEGDAKGIFVDAGVDTVSFENGNVSENTDQGVHVEDGAVEEVDLTALNASESGSASGIDIADVAADAEISVSDVLASDNAGSGVEVSDSVDSVVITEVTAEENAVDGILLTGFDDEAELDVTDSHVEDNTGFGVSVADGSADDVVANVTFSNLVENDQESLNVELNNDGDVNASYNWWTDETGPVVDSDDDAIEDRFGEGTELAADSNTDTEIDIFPFVTVADGAEGDEAIGFEGTVLEDDEETELVGSEVTFDFTNSDTGEDGTFVTNTSDAGDFDHLGDGLYVAIADDAGFIDPATASSFGFAESDEKRFLIDDDDFFATDVEFTLNEGASINGTVFDENMEPVEDESNEFTLLIDDGEETVEDLSTDGDGVYDTVDVTPGEWELQMESETLFVADSNVTTIDVESGDELDDVDFNFAQGEMNASVLDDEGDALADVDEDLELIDVDEDEVIYDSDEDDLETDADGLLGVDGLENVTLAEGSYTLALDHPDFDQSDDVEVEIESGEVTEDVVFEMNEDTTGTLSATVEDSEGDAIADTEVTFTADDVDFERTVETDGSGEVDVDVPSGTYPITATADDFGEDTRTLDIRQSETVSLTFTLEGVGPASNQQNSLSSTSIIGSKNAENHHLGDQAMSEKIEPLPHNVYNYTRIHTEGVR